MNAQELNYDEAGTAFPLWRIVLETVLVTALLPVGAHFLRPQDPFFVQAAFPWITLVPLVLGMRHGSLSGLTSAALLIAAMILTSTQGWAPVPALPLEFLLALPVVGLLAGELSSARQRKLQRLRAALAEEQARTAEVTRTHAVVSASRDRLERQRVTGHDYLRDVLAAVRRRTQGLRVGAAGEPLREAGGAILDAFVEFGHVEAAALYAVDGKSAVGPLAARRGALARVPPDDRLIATALETREMATVGPGPAPRPRGAAEARLLCAIPLVDVTGAVWGLCAVEEMLFTAYQGESLRLLDILSGHFGDLLAFGKASARERFVRELRRGLSDARRHGLSSSVLRVCAPDRRSTAALFQRIVEDRRALDRAMVVDEGQAKMLLLYLPLTGQEGVQRVRDRVEATVREQFGVSAAEAGIRVDTTVLRPGFEANGPLPSPTDRIAA